MEPRRRLTTPSLPALGLALLVVAGGIAAAAAVSSTAEEHAADEARAEAGELALAVDTGFDTAGSVVSLAARAQNPYTVTAPATAAGTLGEVVLADVDLRPERPVDELDEALDAPETVNAVAAARDRGRPVAGATVDDGVLVVAPRYTTGALIDTIEERRTALTGFLVAVIGVDEVQLAAQIATGIRGTVAPAVGHEQAQTAARVTALGRDWDVLVDPPAPDRTLPSAIVIGSLVAAAAIVVVSFAHRVARTQAQREADRRAGEIALVNDVGTVLHSSLDLGDVLPAVAVRLTQEFDLAGLAVAVAGPDGSLADVFAMGGRQTLPPRHVRELPPRVEVTTAEGPDTTELTIPLEQAGRAVGAVWICARTPIDRDARTRILAVADLAGSAIGNARAHDQESVARRHLAELDQMRTEFLATASHELRTPATTIDGFAQLLDSAWEDLPEEQRHDLVHRIARNARSLSQLLEQLLAFTRMERRSLVVEVGAHDVDEIVRRVIDLSSPLLEHHDIVLRSEGPAVAVIDPFAVERVLLNLLTNASKYSPPATDIEVDVERIGDRVVLRVSDQGPGVPIEERHLIFERFYRGASQAALRTRGAGIGLAVVKELLDRLGATIDVSQAPGGGARFTVALPAAEVVELEGVSNGAA